MKILSKGKTTWSKEFSCAECHSKLEVEDKDLVVHNYTVGYAGETWEPEVCFTCPVCKSTNKVTNSVPSGLRYTLIDDAYAKYRR